MIKYQFRAKEENDLPDVPRHAVPEDVAFQFLEWYDEVLPYEDDISDHVKLIEMHGGRTHASVDPDTFLEQGGQSQS